VLKQAPYQQGSDRQYDLIIVGSGLAAQAFLSGGFPSDLRIAVLESGSMDPDPWTQSLRKLESVGLQIALDSRERYLGGTSNTWQNTCVPLDPIDFQPKSWVPLSGWPFDEQELRIFYDRAADYLKIPRIAEVQDILDAGPVCSLVNDEGFVGTVVVDTNEKTGFSPALLKVFQESKSWDLYLGINVTKLQPSPDASRIDFLHGRTRDGQRVMFTAQSIVLACGGIENARLLLLSRKRGFLDRIPMLGCCFMEHPKGEFGRIFLKKPLPNILPFEVFRQKGYRHGFGLRLRPTVQERLGLLNCAVRLLPRATEEHPKHPVRVVAIKNFLEMAPRPDNRIELGSELDLLGQPRGRVLCKTGELEKKSLLTLYRYLSAHLVEQDLGRLESDILETGEWPAHQDASHHMGATRMGLDPSTSVVDENCRLHGVSNLYLAGSSVFPTSGHSNPSYTIVALCLRLQEYLAGILQ
jgi:choline dehydrogenase-like flavoprotein